MLSGCSIRRDSGSLDDLPTQPNEGLAVSPLLSRLPEMADSDDPRRELASLGDVFAAFDQQDSGCLSFGVATRYCPLVRQARPPVGRPRRPCALPCAFMTRCVTRSSWRLPPSPTLGHGRRSSTRGSRGECSTTRQGRAGRVVDCHATVLVPEHRQPREIGDDEEQEVRRAPAGERLPELAARGRRGFQAIRSSAGGFA